MRAPPFRLAVFLSVVLAASGLLHGYAWLRLVHDTGVPIALGAVFALLATALPAAMLGSRVAPAAWRAPLSWGAFLWLGTLFYLDVSLLALDAGRLAFDGVALARAGGGGGVDGTATARTVALLALGATALLVTTGLYRARGVPRVRRVRVPVAGLPAAFDGFRIAQLTDVHVSTLTRRPVVEALVRATNALEPDLVAVTGDLVDGTVPELARDVAPLAGLRAPQGVFFVTGNHEYFSGVDAWSEHVASLGIEVLRNRHVTLERDDQAITLAGIDDAHAPRFGGRTDLAAALEGADRTRPIVLLAHQPRSVDDAAREGVALQISGHTHGGQMQPFGVLVRVEQPWLSGLHRRGGTAVWVSEGTGTWGPPLRIGTRSEISLIELTRA